MTQKSYKTVPFETKKSIKRDRQLKKNITSTKLISDDKTYAWSSKMERVEIIRQGIPFNSIEIVSKKINSPVKNVLSLLDIPQTTYNKKKLEKALLDSHSTELILLIIELIDFGLEVFNNEEEKFFRWLKKSNLSLNGNSPESLLDTVTGLNEVTFALNRIEYGNFA